MFSTHVFDEFNICLMKLSHFQFLSIYKDIDQDLENRGE